MAMIAPEQPYKRAVVRSLTGAPLRSSGRNLALPMNGRSARFSFDTPTGPYKCELAGGRTAASGMNTEAGGKAGGQCTRRNSDRSPNPFGVVC